MSDIVDSVIKDKKNITHINLSKILLNDKNFNEDIVIATGKSQKLSNIVKDIFKKFDLDWKEHVKFSNKSILLIIRAV